MKTTVTYNPVMPVRHWLLLLLLLLPAAVRTQDFGEVTTAIGLKGYWKFSIGDNPQWAARSFNDAAWEEIRVPSPWEEQGFYGYDGFAWYRKHITVPASLKGRVLQLVLGYVDDVDEVYINGKLIGASGKFPPAYETAYNAYRAYYVPMQYLRYDEDNVIAVRVYDDELSGGILSGAPGLYMFLSDGPPADFSLEGEWAFKQGDNTAWKEPVADDKNWSSIIVPSYWEVQGYANYDGFAWYRKKVTLPKNFNAEGQVLMLGKIDDFDQVYINGQWVGGTGNMTGDVQSRPLNEYWQRFRGYYVSPGILKPGEVNTIAVRVYDGYINGGIYTGPIGFITREKYAAYWQQQNRRNSGSFWERFFRWFNN